MRSLSSQQSKGIFRQLADVAGGAGVKMVIENHDAWVHNDEVEAEITIALCQATAARPRTPELSRRLAAQRRALAPLVNILPSALSHAG